MVPVSLQLKNFMSYGTAAPVLDFETFQVACLSGRNGQGKSALLDAITWSLWGEARKSSGGHKPDDELIRIGEREMQVEFVFDIEGERFRVVRSYSRSATGKTSRSDLELHVFEPSNDDFRPLTGPSQKDTQDQISRVVGLDYDTFINSAFLLQGRSDEFTKKRPGERKEILTRILNLDRYERLYELALSKERDARRLIEQAAADVERLQEALGAEQEWKDRHAAVSDAITREGERLTALRAEEKALTERLAGLDARATEAESVRRTLAATQARQDDYENEAAGLRERIATAEALIAQHEQIRKDHERYVALQAERDALDEKNEVFRGVEKQIARAEREFHEHKNTMERKLDRLSVELKNQERILADCTARLAERPAVEQRLEQAMQARRQAEAMADVHQERRRLLEDRDREERAIARAREELGARLAALDEQVAREQRTLPDPDRLVTEAEYLQGQVDEREKQVVERDEIEVLGKQIAEELNRLAGTFAAKKSEREELHDQQGRLSREDDAICPTCGTELTDAHRTEVHARFAARLAGLDETLAGLQGQMDQRKRRRDDLRSEYVRLVAAIKERDAATERLVRVREQLRVTREAREALGERVAEADRLRKTLQEEDYAAEERDRLRALDERLRALSFDEEAFERLKAEAAQVSRYEDRRRQLEETAGRKEQVEASLASLGREIEDVRKSLDDGAAFQALRDQIDRFRRQLDDVGFDAERFRRVKSDLDALKDAGRRMNDLVNARDNQAAWKEQLAAVEERAAQTAAEWAVQKERLAEVERELEARDGLAESLASQSLQCREAESALHGLQVQLGQLSEKLEKARQDRAALRQRRAERKEAEREAALYKHLKAAFSKHGIPSLIIEQTLPEIEERTNDLLERLTDGRMHVRLETLKDKKTGGTRETLELRITDEQGVSRPYETYSGGEAFRVNFALRIALAQLLAERSGVRVRSLVVDEGFGTQDQQGVQNLVEAIQTIQDDFDKILVITHLPELKEAFPVRIEVEKDAVEGSRFEVIGV